MLEIDVLDSTAVDFSKRLQKSIANGSLQDQTVTEKVCDIIQQVRTRGDDALLEYATKFDQVQADDIAQLRVTATQIDQAMKDVSEEALQALQQAAARVREYARRQCTQDWCWEETGISVGQRTTPLESVGLYIPGGTAVYPSSVLMTAIPAQVAGVKRIVVTLSSPQGVLNPLVLAALRLCNIEEIYMLGGAQAVAALAYGTQSIPRVNKIVGPGNRYVTEAKRQVFGAVGIDMLAGPSEIVVLADASCDAQWVAADLLSQAEHDEQARAILISTDMKYIRAVEKSMEFMLRSLSRATIIRKSLRNHGVFIKVANLQEGVDVVNAIAPEHLELMVEQPRSLLLNIQNAGAIFLGRYACEALGDYCAGPSHVLPTAGAAKFSSPLGVYDFQKRSSIIECSATGAADLAPIAQRLAQEESLSAHALSAQYRVIKQ